MAAAGKHRECLIAAAVGLFRRQGYAATGLAEILSASGAPRGSLYHYFPAGKAEIAEAALRAAAHHMTGIMQGMASSSASPGEMVLRYGAGLAAALEKSGFRDGCAVATVVLEAAPGSPKLAAAGSEAFAAWAEVVAAVLCRAGIPQPRAQELAEFSIAAFEGALLLARAKTSTAPVLATAQELRHLFESELLRKRSV